MEGGQPIDPGLIQALASIGSTNLDTQNLNQQMAMAQAMRQPINPGTQMAGRVAIRQSPLVGLNAGINNAMSAYRQNQAMQNMQALAEKIRDVKGRFMNALDANQNPKQVHPDSLASLGNSSINNVGQDEVMPTSYDAMPGEEPQ